MAVIGYARVSSVGQSLEVQQERLNAFGCDRVFAEKMSGLDASRPELRQCLSYVREGDTLVITKLDRLGRNAADLLSIVGELERQGIGFKVLDESLDTTTRTGKLMLGLLSLIAEFETNLRKERQAEGIARAKRQGVRFGQPLKLTETLVTHVQSLRDQGRAIKEIMEVTSLSRASVYRALSADAEGA